MSDQFASTVTTFVAIVLAIAGELYIAAAVGFAWVLYNLLAALSEFEVLAKRWPSDRDRMEAVRWLTVVGFVLFVVLRILGVAL